MAKFTVTVAVAVFLFVLTLAQARIPSDLPDNDVVRLESDPTTTAATKTILLPSEKLQSEPEAVEAEAKPAEKPETEKPESETDDSVPLTIINFHPISRHFPHDYPSLTFRHRRPCRQYHRPGKPFGFHHREINYGNDMLTSNGEKKNEEIRQIPARWVKFHHGDIDGPKFPNWREDDVEMKHRFRMPRHHRHQHFHRHHEEEEEKERHGKEHESGFLMKVRKFLNHF